MNKATAVYTSEMNEYLNEVVKFCSQYIYGLESSNPLEEYFPLEDVTDGKDVEISVIGKASAQAFDPTGANIWAQHKPDIKSVYNPKDWDIKQFIQTIRPDDIRECMARGQSAAETAAKIMDATTQGDANYRYKQLREIMTATGFYKDYKSISKYEPKTMAGVLFLCKDAYQHLTASNADCCADTVIEMETPASDVYTLIPSKVLNLLETTELANLYNLEKANLIGTIIPVNVDDLDVTNWYKIKVIDKKVVRRYRRIYDYAEDRNNTGRFSQHILTTECLSFLCGLFKAVEIDATVACEAKLAEIATKSDA